VQCRGLHCDGCGGGGGPAICAAVILLIIAGVIAAHAKAIGHFAAEVGHVLVLVVIAGASVTAATVAVTLGLVIRRKLRQAERATGQMRATLTGHGYRELPEHRAEIPARADMPAEVYIHPPREQGRVIR
jgi:hypothetical protein